MLCWCTIGWRIGCVPTHSAEISFTSTVIPFDRTPNEPSNFPQINSSRLRELILVDLPLRTDAAGIQWTLPSLSLLHMQDLPGVTLPLAVVAQSFVLQDLELLHIAVSGELSDLLSLRSLRSLLLSTTGLVSSMDGISFSSVWPKLTSVSITGATLIGAVPSLANLTILTLLQLDDCGLVGELPSDFLQGCSSLSVLSIARNPLLGGKLPSLVDAATSITRIDLQLNNFDDTLEWFFSEPFLQLMQLSLSSQHIHGSLPSNMWEQMPLISEFSVAFNSLAGPIPVPSTQIYLNALNFASNSRLNGSFPAAHLSASFIDISSTSIGGALILTSTPTTPIMTLSVAGSLITCPLQLPLTVVHLELQGAAFAGCDFQSDITVLPQLDYLDVSSIAWKQPFQFLLPSSLRELVAVDAAITSVASLDPSVPPMITTIDISQNPLDPASQASTFAFFSSCASLEYLSFSSSGVQMEVSNLVNLMPRSIREIRADGNQLKGSFSNLMFTRSSVFFDIDALQATIQLLDFSRNPHLLGPLPNVGGEYASLVSIDLSFTNVSGAIPSSLGDTGCRRRSTSHDRNRVTHGSTTSTQ